MLIKNKTNLIINLFCYIFFISLILLVVLRHYNYEFGQVLYTGDLRIHSHFPLENSESLYNFRLMFETTPFVSLYPILSLFKFLSIEQIYFFILFAIPILAFFSMDFVLRQYIPTNLFIKRINFKIFVTTSLSFIYIFNPSYFNRIGHWNINYLYIFIPLFYFFCDEFLKKKGKFYNLLIIFPVIFYGVSSPHALVAFTGILALLIICNFEKSVQYFLKSISIILIHTYAISHNFLAMILKENLMLRTTWEGETNQAVLTGLSRNSSFISSVSGTNFYYDLLINHPTSIGAGLVAFIIILFLIVKSKKFTGEDLKFTCFILISLFINLGYKTMSFWFDNFFLKLVIVKDLLWLIKDSNIFYNFLIFFLIVYLVKKISNQSKTFILGVVLVLFFLNLYQLIFSNIDKYKDFFKPIRVTEAYQGVSGFLSKENKRTLWIPNGVYIDNKLAPEITYFPNFNLWLTRNPEITIGNNLYLNFAKVLNEEVVIKKCRNIQLISWLIKSNGINLVIDKNSKSEKVDFFYNCLSKISSVSKIYSDDDIYVFTSNLELKSTESLIKFSGSLDQLNEYLINNPINYVQLEETRAEQPSITVVGKNDVELVLVPFHPSLTFNNQKILAPVNFISSVFIKGNDEEVSGLDFKNNSIFKAYLNIQSSLNLVSIFLFLMVMPKRLLKKYE